LVTQVHISSISSDHLHNFNSGVYLTDLNDLKKSNIFQKHDLLGDLRFLLVVDRLLQLGPVGLFLYGARGRSASVPAWLVTAGDAPVTTRPVSHARRGRLALVVDFHRFEVGLELRDGQFTVCFVRVDDCGLWIHSGCLPDDAVERLAPLWKGVNGGPGDWLDARQDSDFDGSGLCR
jgi:hypothetical protein